MPSIATISLLSELRKEHPHINPLSFKFRTLLSMKLAEHPSLNEREIKKILVGNFGTIFLPRPNNIPETWEFLWCHKFLAPKYKNPDPSEDEYVIVMPNVSRGFLPYLLHSKDGDWVDSCWFSEIVPGIERILANSGESRPFSGRFNEYVNQLFGHQMTVGQVDAINLFFQKFVPGIEEICTSCFNVSLPRTGAGQRWIQKNDNPADPDWEIRLSAAKPWGMEGQREPYVSHTEDDGNGNKIYATWNDPHVGFSDNMTQKSTHIPWVDYDYQKFSLNMPVCTCTK